MKYVNIYKLINYRTKKKRIFLTRRYHLTVGPTNFGIVVCFGGSSFLSLTLYSACRCAPRNICTVTQTNIKTKVSYITRKEDPGVIVEKFFFYLRIP